MQKHNEDKVKEEFKNKGINVLDEYKAYNTPMLCEKDGYKFYMSYKELIEDYNICLFGKKCEFQLENIIFYFKRKYPDIQVINVENVKKKGTSKTYVKLKCSCGNYFKKEWVNIYNLPNKYMICNKCRMNKHIK